MNVIVWFKKLFKKNKVKALYTNEERMDITDPDWRSDVERERSYGKISLVIFGAIAGAIVIYFGWHELEIAANSLHCTPFELLLRIYYHIFPHIPLPGRDLVK